MAYEQFLSGYPDEERRKRLWAYFRDAEREARTFATSADGFVPITRVIVDADGAKWHANGELSIAPTSPPGVMLHEIFQSAFQASVFHQGKDAEWEEAWCDAFRYVAESELVVPPSGWVEQMRRTMKMTFDEALAQSGDAEEDERGPFPASLILKETDGTSSGLRRLWLELADKRKKTGGDVLSAFFGYAIAPRRPL